MITAAVNQCRFLMNYAESLVLEIPDDRFAEQPAPNVNHPAWIIGHLAFTADLCVGLLEGESVATPDWVKLFKGGTSLTSVRADYPSKDELLERFRERNATAMELALNAPEELLSGPTKHPRFKSTMPENRDVATFLLSSHVAIHLGQLSMWRRLIGFSPLF